MTQHDNDLNTLLIRLEHDGVLTIEWSEKNNMKSNECKCHC